MRQFAGLAGSLCPPTALAPGSGAALRGPGGLCKGGDRQDTTPRGVGRRGLWSSLRKGALVPPGNLNLTGIQGPGAGGARGSSGALEVVQPEREVLRLGFWPRQSRAAGRAREERPPGQWRGLGPATSPGSPELFHHSRQALLGLQARLIDLPLALAAVRVAGQQSAWAPGAEHTCLYPLITGPTSPGAWRTVGGEGGPCGKCGERRGRQPRAKENGRPPAPGLLSRGR